MRRLLLAGAYRQGSGLTNVLEGLATALRPRFDLDVVGFRTGEAADGEALLAGRPIKVFRGTPLVYAADPAWLEARLEATRPDAVLVSGPGFMAWGLLRQLEAYRRHGRVALYMPLEGTLAGEVHARVIRRTDACLLYTKDALAGVEALCRRASSADPAFRTPLMAAVGHGFDSTRFHSIGGNRRDQARERERRRRARAMLFPDRTDLADAFIVLNANRQSRRKRLDLTLDAFASFADGKQDAHLLLHTGHRWPEQDGELRRQIAEAGIEDRVLLSPGSADLLLTPDHLNLVYNACDVGLSTSAGEGWGLGIFEQAATRAAQVVPDHTSFRENWSGAALLVPVRDSEFYFSEGCDIHNVSPAAAAARLEQLYRDPRFRLEMAARAQERALDPDHRWASVAARIGDALEAALDAGRSRLQKLTLADATIPPRTSRPRPEATGSRSVS